MTPGSAAGYLIGLPELRALPAEATTTTPLERAYATALVTALSCALPPSDMLITWAQWSAEYVMPVRVNRERGEGDGFSEEAFYFEETRGSLELRVRRLETEYAWAEDPPSRTRHFVTNVRVAPGEEEDEVAVRSNLLLYRSRGSDPRHDLISAERKDVLRKEDGQWKLKKRVILLDHSILTTHNLSIFL